MKLHLSLAGLLFACLFVITSCKKEKIDTPTETLATISGRVYAANGYTPIGGALVELQGTSYNTRSAYDGLFEIKAPAGNYNLVITTGDGELYKTIVPVNVSTGQVLALTPSQTQLDLTGNLAFIAGPYDKIEAIVQDSLGYPITELFDYDLLDSAYLSTFDAIFVNCGAPDAMLTPQSYANLNAYVQNGGSMYVSDFGTSYLLGPYDFSTTCNRMMGFIDDSLLCTSKSGISTLLSGVSVNDVNFQTAIGSSTMDVYYDLGGWEVVNNYNPTFWEAIVSDVTYGPLMLRNTTYSADGGKIYFTTFHNNPNGAIGNDVENMLQYVILDL